MLLLCTAAGCTLQARCRRGWPRTSGRWRCSRGTARRCTTWAWPTPSWASWTGRSSCEGVWGVVVGGGGDWGHWGWDGQGTRGRGLQAQPCVHRPTDGGGVTVPPMQVPLGAGSAAQLRRGTQQPWWVGRGLGGAGLGGALCCAGWLARSRRQCWGSRRAADLLRCSTAAAFNRFQLPPPLPLLPCPCPCPAGVLYRELGNMERTVQCYQAALNVRPNFPQVCAGGRWALGTG